MSSGADAAVIQLQATSTASSSARQNNNDSIFDTASGTDLATYQIFDNFWFGENWGRTSSSATELKLEVSWDGDGGRAWNWDRSGATMSADFTVDEAVEVEITRDWSVISDSNGMGHTSFEVINADTGETVVRVEGDPLAKTGTSSIVLLAGVNYRFEAIFGNTGSTEFREAGLASTTFTVVGAASISAVPGAGAALLGAPAIAGLRRRRRR